MGKPWLANENNKTVYTCVHQLEDEAADHVSLGSIAPVCICLSRKTFVCRQVEVALDPCLFIFFSFLLLSHLILLYSVWHTV